MKEYLMNIKEMKYIISKLPNKYTPMLKGIHGVGKTEVIRQIAKHIWNLECIELQGSQLSDVGDLIGLQRISKDNSETEWVPPYWMPKDGRPICLFLDELNRAPKQIRKAMMQIGNDHRILNMKLPEGSRVIVAINPSEDGDYDVDEFDLAELDRFVIYNFTPTVDECLEYWTQQNVHNTVIEFISQNSIYLDPPNNFNEYNSIDNNYPSRRSWFKFSETLKEFEKDEELTPNIIKLLASGFLGYTTATAFVDFYNQRKNGLTPKKILEAKDFSLIKEDIKLLCETKMFEALNLGKTVCRYLSEKDNKINDNIGYSSLVAKNLYNFFKACTPELQFKIYNEGVKLARSKNKKWVSVLSNKNPKLRDLYIDLVNFEV